MTLKNLPLDAARLGVALCVSVEAKTDPETGVIKTDRDGKAVWAVGVAVRPEGRKTALIEVSVTGEPSGIEVGQVVSLVGLEAFWWEMNGRAGLAYRAESVVAAPPAARPAVERPASGGAAK
ncbi:hypothetical protein SAMN05216371_1331 [Streptomyces sp. TLI_053]|uniref:SCO3933 family regulatory protein n=1 Tax=Streptomyces sp. TLI_053 TaxID=1855352 RepID=UPI00087BD29D|nr:hypothetical protein [Streptomyces sp. TLI_053]SDT11939.1 hypothetical protein SAMN05216371_1331 [Streptomyces sp. TLI_053]